jgi:hypothetical protein
MWHADKLHLVTDYQAEVSKPGPEETLLILVKRGETSFYITLRKEGSPKSSNS